MVKLFNSQRFKLVRVENHARNENEMQNLRLEQMFVVQRFSSGFILGINQVTEQTGCSYCKNLVQAKNFCSSSLLCTTRKSLFWEKLLKSSFLVSNIFHFNFQQQFWFSIRKTRTSCIIAERSLVVGGLLSRNVKYVKTFKKSYKLIHAKSEISSLPFRFRRKGFTHVSVIRELESVSFYFLFLKTLVTNER